MGYQGLANTSVTLNQLITASGTLLTPANVMTQSLPGSEWSTIWQDAVANQVVQIELRRLAHSRPVQRRLGLELARLGSAIGLALSDGVHQRVVLRTNGTISTAALSTSLQSHLQTLTTEAEAANGSNALNVTSALGLTGAHHLQRATGISPGSGTQGRLRAVGTTASTAQVLPTFR